MREKGLWEVILYSLANSLRELIFREDLFLYNSSLLGVPKAATAEPAAMGATASAAAASEPELQSENSAETDMLPIADR